MERNGIILDTTACEEIRLQATEDERATLAKLRAWAREAGWYGDDAPDELVDDLWSSSTVGLPAFLHGEAGLGLPPSPIFAKGRLRDGEISTDHAALDYLASHNPDQRENIKTIITLRQQRSAVKYTTTFPTFVTPDGLVHPTFGASDSDGGDGGTVTERLSCKKPPLAQWPRSVAKDLYRLRRLLVAPPGQVIVAVDAQALEVVVLADYLIWRLGDDRLAARLADTSADIHSRTTAALFPEMGLTAEQISKGRKLGEWVGPLPGRPRSVAWNGAWDHLTIPEVLALLRDAWAKVTRYALHYGKREWGLGHTMLDANGDPIGEDAARALIEQFLSDEPWLSTYMDEVWWRLSKFGGITALDGHALDVRSLWASGKWGQRSAWRKGLNYPMQKGGARLVNIWMYLVATDPEIARAGGKLRLQMHDELVLTAPERNAHSVQAMVQADLDKACREAGLLVPLLSSGGIGPTWYDAKG